MSPNIKCSNRLVLGQEAIGEVLLMLGSSPSLLARYLRRSRIPDSRINARAAGGAIRVREIRNSGIIHRSCAVVHVHCGGYTQAVVPLDAMNISTHCGRTGLQVNSRTLHNSRRPGLGSCQVRADRSYLINTFYALDFV